MKTIPTSLCAEILSVARDNGKLREAATKGVNGLPLSPEEKQHIRQWRWKQKNRASVLAYNIKNNAKISADQNLSEKRNQQARVSRKRCPKTKVYHWERDPFKESARNAVYKARRNGTLKRLPCAVCGNPKSQAHHDDYSKPLEVRWFCSKHHKAIHMEESK